MKSAVQILVALFLTWHSVRLTWLLPRADLEWPLAVFLGWLFALMLTGAFAFLGYALPTERLLPEAYHRVARPGRLSKVCRLLGVDLFRRALLASLQRTGARRRLCFDGTRGNLDRLDEKSRKSEFGHVVPVVLLTGVGLVHLAVDAARVGVVVLFVNVVGNL